MSFLQIRIIVTQAMGEENVLLDLTAVRLASLNQTLDPWLYILLRRSTCIKIIKGFRRIKNKYLKTKDEKLQGGEFLDNLHLIDDKNYNKHQNVDMDNEIPKPDVMQNADGRNKSPLPDITNMDVNKERKGTFDVCHFQNGKPVTPDDDKMFVKFQYVNNNSTSKINNGRPIERPVLCQDNDKRRLILPPPETKLYSVSNSYSNGKKCGLKSSEFGTKETSLSHDFDPTFRSEHGNYSPTSSNKIHQR